MAIKASESDALYQKAQGIMTELADERMLPTERIRKTQVVHTLLLAGILVELRKLNNA